MTSSRKSGTAASTGSRHSRRNQVSPSRLGGKSSPPRKTKVGLPSNRRSPRAGLAQQGQQRPYGAAAAPPGQLLGLRRVDQDRGVEVGRRPLLGPSGQPLLEGQQRPVDHRRRGQPAGHAGQHLSELAQRVHPGRVGAEALRACWRSAWRTGRRRTAPAAPGAARSGRTGRRASCPRSPGRRRWPARWCSRSRRTSRDHSAASWNGEKGGSSVRVSTAATCSVGPGWGTTWTAYGVAGRGRSDPISSTCT